MGTCILVICIENRIFYARFQNTYRNCAFSMQMTRRKYRLPRRKKPYEMPVMQAKCKSCPFREDTHGGNVNIRNSVINRTLFSASQICHSTGYPHGTHLCRGMRDIQLQVMCAMGVLEEPTDACWQETWENMNKRK